MADYFSFPTAYSIEVDPEFPGTGEWDCSTFNFSRDGTLAASPESRWGTPFVVRIEPDGGAPWVGIFAAGGLGGVRDALACPSPQDIAVIADGLAYVVDVEHPDRGATVASDQVQEVVAVEEPPLLLFVRFSEIDALGNAGIAWSSRRLCVDELRVRRATSDAIECTGWNGGGESEITVDPRTGQQVAGVTLHDLGWPGE